MLSAQVYIRHTPPTSAQPSSSASSRLVSGSRCPSQGRRKTPWIASLRTVRPICRAVPRSRTCVRIRGRARSFRSGLLVVAMLDPATKEERPVTLERERYVEHLRAMLYSTIGARLVPLVVHRAFQWDFRRSRRWRRGITSVGRPHLAACTSPSRAVKPLPFISEQDIVRTPGGTFLGDRCVRAHMDACRQWPRGAVPPRFTDPITTDIPVVMFSGDADGSTPAWVAEAAIASMPNGRRILVPHRGHQIYGPWTWDLMQSFFRRPSVRDLDAACVTRAQRPPFAL